MYKEKLDKIKGKTSKFYYDYCIGELFTEDTIEKMLAESQNEFMTFEETVEDIEPVELHPVPFEAEKMLLYYLQEVRDDFPVAFEPKKIVKKIDTNLMTELQMVLDKITKTGVINYID
jgi:tRNA G26 N,N-dimethylase Trm1